MGTTTALLLWGEGHPYDAGLWGDFSNLRLIEGDRCSWVQDAPHLVWPANPTRIFKDGLRAAGGAPHWDGCPSTDSWEKSQYREAFAGKRIILCILKGSSLKPERCLEYLEALDIDGEILSNIPSFQSRKYRGLRSLILE